MITGQYNPSARIMVLVSHTTYVEKKNVRWRTLYKIAMKRFSQVYRTEWTLTVGAIIRGLNEHTVCVRSRRG